MERDLERTCGFIASLRAPGSLSDARERGEPHYERRASTVDPYRDTVKPVNEDQGDSDEVDRPRICPACGVTMGIREHRTSTRFVCLECGFSDEAGSGS